MFIRIMEDFAWIILIAITPRFIFDRFFRDSYVATIERR